MSELKATLTGTQDVNGKTYGPWMRKNMKEKDPWGREYKYTRTSGTTFELMSQGADASDQSDDISYNNL